MIVVLAGGVGGSKLLKGLSSTQEEIKAIINTGDDIERFGLHISPDVDINLYTLANLIHRQGWGFQNETFASQSVLSEVFQQDCWFNLGDKDLATHIYRTHLLKQGKKLSQITDLMRRKLDVDMEILPMTDESVSTYIQTESGVIHFQEYLIKRKMKDRVLDITYKGRETAKPVPGILKILKNASIILFAPSNPLVSIGPILSIPGIKDTIKKSKAKVVAVSPIVNGGVIKGPADRMMKDLNIEVSPMGIVDYYGDLLDAVVIDNQDELYKRKLKERGLHVLVTDTIMNIEQKKIFLAKQIVNWTKQNM